jgi:hypothetical protein
MTATPISWPSCTVGGQQAGCVGGRAAGTCARVWVSSGLTKQQHGQHQPAPALVRPGGLELRRGAAFASAVGAQHP